jgi:hypothetical protein
MPDIQDPIAFATENIDELKARMAQVGNPNATENYQKTPREIAIKFFNDQGHNFGQIDIDAVLSLLTQKNG